MEVEILSPEQVDFISQRVERQMGLESPTEVLALIETLRQAWQELATAREATDVKREWAVKLMFERAECGRLAKLLHDLTPGGSEFASNPDRCAKWLAGQQSLHIRMMVEAKATIQELEESYKSLLNANVTLGAERDQLRERLTQYEGENLSIKQTLGKALDCPWYKDDQKNFPGADESDGVCVGPATAETLAVLVADRLELMKAKVGWLTEGRDAFLGRASEEVR